VTALEKLKELARLFEREGIEEAAMEAALLLTEILRISKTKLHSSPPEIDETMSKKIDSLAARRVHGEPIQYIIGHVEFWGLRIHVGKGVLIPRPETELLVEETIRLIRLTDRCMGDAVDGDRQSLSILDLCTGSGCIALALAKSFPRDAVYGIDKSAQALQYAKRNAEYNGIDNVAFIEGDLISPLQSGVCFDCIVSNPPYIRKADIPGLQKEIAYEPIEALDGGDDGLYFYRRIFNQAPRHLKKKGGFVILEIGFDQSEDIRLLAASQGFKYIRVVKDYAGIDRIFVGRCQEAM
jgi:release factor glutamine methyltransferase